MQLALVDAGAKPVLHIFDMKRLTAGETATCCRLSKCVKTCYRTWLISSQRPEHARIPSWICHLTIHHLLTPYRDRRIIPMALAVLLSATLPSTFRRSAPLSRHMRDNGLPEICGVAGTSSGPQTVAPSAGGEGRLGPSISDTLGFRSTKRG